MCCWFDIVRLTGRGGAERSGSVKLTHHERWWGWDVGGEAGDGDEGGEMVGMWGIIFSFSAIS